MKLNWIVHTAVLLQFIDNFCLYFLLKTDVYCGRLYKELQNNWEFDSTFEVTHRFA